MLYSLRSSAPHILALAYVGLRNTICIVAAFYYTLGCLAFETLEELVLRLAQATSPTYVFELPTGEALYDIEYHSTTGVYNQCQLKLSSVRCSLLERYRLLLWRGNRYLRTQYVLGSRTVLALYRRTTASLTVGFGLLWGTCQERVNALHASVMKRLAPLLTLTVIGGNRLGIATVVVKSSLLASQIVSLLGQLWTGV